MPYLLSRRFVLTPASGARTYEIRLRREIERGSLFAKRLGSQEFKITLVQLPHVLLEAKEIGQGSEHEQFLSKCGSRFELFISDLDAALDEINSLMEAQVALQDASSGYLFTPWNGQIMKPWNAS